MQRQSHNRLPQHPLAARCAETGFTLVELLVSMTVLSILLLMLLMITDGTQKIWRRTSSSIRMFERARAAFDIISRRLSQSTLNPYLDYYDATWTRRDPASTTFTPTYYGRASDLHFRSGPTTGILGAPPAGVTYATHSAFFFAPLGYADNNASYRDLPNLLNPVGYFIEFADDSANRPQFINDANLPKRYRYRLVEVVQPAQDFKGFPALTNTIATDDLDWITSANGLKTSTYKHILAENIIAFVVRPELTDKDATAAGLTKGWNLTDGYSYNSRVPRTTSSSVKDKIQFSQLPPLVRVTMVAVDDGAAARLAKDGSIPPVTTPPAVFDTSTLFIDPDKFDADLKTLEAKLSAARVQFRTFSSVISLRSAKWSQNN